MQEFLIPPEQSSNLKRKATHLLIMSNSSNQRSSNPMSLDSLLNNEAIGNSRDEVTSRFRACDVATSNSPQRHLPPLASKSYPKGKRSSVKPKKITTSSKRSYTNSLLPREISAGRSTTKRPHQTTGRRPSRPKYEHEQAIFIWYMRTDLKLSWDKVVHKYNTRFSKYRDKAGIQCRFYRELKNWRVAKVREQNSHSNFAKNDEMVGQYGVVQRTNSRFAWMKPEHFHTSCLAKFR